MVQYWAALLVSRTENNKDLNHWQKDGTLTATSIFEVNPFWRQNDWHECQFVKPTWKLDPSPPRRRLFDSNAQDQIWKVAQPLHYLHHQLRLSTPHQLLTNSSFMFLSVYLLRISHFCLLIYGLVSSLLIFLPVSFTTRSQTNEAKNTKFVSNSSALGSWEWLHPHYNAEGSDRRPHGNVDTYVLLVGWRHGR